MSVYHKYDEKCEQWFNSAVGIGTFISPELLEECIVPLNYGVSSESLMELYWAARVGSKPR